MKTTRRLQKRGFTLVEILVVIAIIIALAAISFSLAGKAQRSAMAASNLSNLRAIGVAAGAWMAENQGYYPPCWNNTEGANRSYAQTLDPYMHGLENYRSTESKFIGPNKRLPVKVTPFSHPITYSMNRAVCRDITQIGDESESLVHVTQVERPDEIILLADGCQNPSNLNQANASAYKLIGETGTSGDLGKYSKPIPIGPNEDTSSGDGWFRYSDGSCHALTCSGAAKSFKLGTIKYRNIWIDNARN